MKLAIKTCLLFAVGGCLCLVTSSAGAALFLVEDFTGVDENDATKGPTHAYGSTLSAGGHTLTSQLNGSEASQLAYAGDRTIVAGLGVGNPGEPDNVGFTRSINNSETDAETIQLDLADGQGLTTLYVANGASATASVVTISGFASDPGASSADGTTGYSAGTLTWEVSSQNSLELGGLTGNQISVLNLADASASSGASLVFGNGTVPSEANEYGLRAFEAIPEPSAGVLFLFSVVGLMGRTRYRKE